MTAYTITTLPRDTCASWWAATDHTPNFAPTKVAQISEVECSLCLAAHLPGMPAIWSRSGYGPVGSFWPELIQHLAHVHGVRPEPYECPA